MASKLWQGWSFPKTFFIYDHEIVKREEDDPKMAVIFFDLESQSVPVSEDVQSLFSGQLMAMVSFLDNLVSSKPKLYCLKKMKIATVHEGRFTMAMASSFNTPDELAIQKLNNLQGLFRFFQGSLHRILQEHDNDHGAFASQIGEIMPSYLSVVCPNKVHETFQDIPTAVLPKKSHLTYLKASHLLQWLKRRPKLLGGCIIYNQRILCTQMTTDITRYLLTARLRQNLINLQAIPASPHFLLPQGVQMVAVFLTEEEYLMYTKNKQPPGKEKPAENVTSVHSQELKTSQDISHKQGQRAGAHFEVGQNIAEGIAIGMNKSEMDEQKKKENPRRLEETSMHQTDGARGNKNDGRSKLEAACAPRGEYKELDKIVIEGIVGAHETGMEGHLKSERNQFSRGDDKDSNKATKTVVRRLNYGFQDLRTSNGESVGMQNCISDSGITKSESDFPLAEKSEEDSSRDNLRHDVGETRDGAHDEDRYKLNDGSALEVNNVMNRTRTSEAIIDERGDAEYISENKDSRSIGDSDVKETTFSGNECGDLNPVRCNNRHIHENGSAIAVQEESRDLRPQIDKGKAFIRNDFHKRDKGRNAIMQDDSTMTHEANVDTERQGCMKGSKVSSRKSAVGNYGSDEHLLAGSQSSDENNDDGADVGASIPNGDVNQRMTRHDPKENVRTHGKDYQIKLQESMSSTASPRLGQRSSNTAVHVSNRGKPQHKKREYKLEADDVFTSEARSTSVGLLDEENDDVLPQVPGMVAVCMFIGVHSDNLTVVFLGEKTLQADEQEVNNIWRTIQSQSADLDEELRQAEERNAKESSQGTRNLMSFNAFEHSLTIETSKSQPTDDSSFFSAARFLHNEFNKDPDLQRVHLSTDAGSIVGDQQVGSQVFQHMSRTEAGLTLLNKAALSKIQQPKLKGPLGDLLR